MTSEIQEIGALRVNIVHVFFIFQSVVLISKLPFVALFSQLVSIIAPEYFENGEPSLEAGK